MDGLLITRAALHALLTDAHRAMVEHRPEFAGAVLHVLRRATAPEFAAGAGLARRLAQETDVAAGGGNGWRGDGAEPIGEAALPMPQAGTPAPPTFHAPSLAAEEAQPAHAHHLPDGPGPGFQPGCTPSAEAPPIAAAPAPAPAQAAGGATSPRARARSGTPNTGRAGGVWNPARDELLTRLWHEGKTAGEALPLLNEVPAPSPIASEMAIYARAHLLGIKRPPEVAALLLRRAGRIGAERAAELAAAGVSSLGAKPLVWTQERLALGQRLWEAGERAEDMLPRLNELPAAATVPNAQAIRSQAAKQGWIRPESFIAAKRAGHAERMRAMAAARAAKPAARPEQRAATDALPEAPPPAAPIALAAGPDAEKAEAMELFAAGQTVRQVAADLGATISVVASWHAEWKLRRRGTAA